MPNTGAEYSDVSLDPDRVQFTVLNRPPKKPASCIGKTSVTSFLNYFLLGEELLVMLSTRSSGIPLEIKDMQYSEVKL